MRKQTTPPDEPSAAPVPDRDLAREILGHAGALTSAALDPLTRTIRENTASIEAAEPGLMEAHRKAEAEFGAEVRGYARALASPILDTVPDIKVRLQTARECVRGLLASLAEVPERLTKARALVDSLTLELVKTEPRRAAAIDSYLRTAGDHVALWPTAMGDVRYHVGRVRDLLERHPQAILSSGFREFEKQKGLPTKAKTDRGVFS